MAGEFDDSELDTDERTYSDVDVTEEAVEESSEEVTEEATEE